MQVKGRPLETRIFRQRNPKMSFFCPLCRTQREFIYSEKLPFFHKLIIFLISLLLMIALYSLMAERVFVIPLIVWALYELSWKLLHRREIPCPHCGFDAVWYKRDVRMAKKLVKDFWREKNAPAPKLEEEEVELPSDDTVTG